MTPPMTDLQTLIRTADQNDKAACNELNNEFYWFLAKTNCTALHEYSLCACSGYCTCTIEFTEDLNALKAVQDAELEGWEMSICSDKERGFNCNIGDKYSDWLQTMQLAWMDALVAAIQWKRGNNGK